MTGWCGVCAELWISIMAVQLETNGKDFQREGLKGA